MIRTLGSLVDGQDRAKRLTDDLVVATTNARRRASRLPFRPKVYFEEWDDPMISGIAWVSVAYFCTAVYIRAPSTKRRRCKSH